MSAAERLSFYPPLLSVSFPRKYTVEEYLKIEAQSENKLEYVNGYIVPTDMGGTFTHRPFLTVFSNNANGLHTFENYDVNNPIIVLSDLDITIALADIYEDVDFGN